MQESFLKAAHAQRTEAAQARKEEKRRAEKDRIMAEDDPDKQRRLEVSANISGLQYDSPWEYNEIFF